MKKKKCLFQNYGKEIYFLFCVCQYFHWRWRKKLYVLQLYMDLCVKLRLPIASAWGIAVNSFSYVNSCLLSCENGVPVLASDEVLSANLGLVLVPYQDNTYVYLTSFHDFCEHCPGVKHTSLDQQTMHCTEKLLFCHRSWC